MLQQFWISLQECCKVLTSESIQKLDKLIKLLQALAYQVGSQVSYHELGQICELSSKTI